MRGGAKSMVPVECDREGSRPPVTYFSHILQEQISLPIIGSAPARPHAERSPLRDTCAPGCLSRACAGIQFPGEASPGFCQTAGWAAGNDHMTCAALPAFGCQDAEVVADRVGRIPADRLHQPVVLGRPRRDGDPRAAHTFGDGKGRRKSDDPGEITEQAWKLVAHRLHALNKVPRAFMAEIQSEDVC